MGTVTWPANLLDASYATTVLQAIADKNFDVSFADVTSSIGSGDTAHTATFRVFADALKIDGVRINVSATLEQQIADALGCVLLTTKLADLTYAQRHAALTPLPMPIASTSAAMLKESSLIDAALAKAGGADPGQIVQTVGKHWVISNTLTTHPGKACNYGWMVPAATTSPWQGVAVYPSVTLTAKVIQQPSWAHDASHLDYSQTCVLAHRRCVVDGVDRDLLDVLRDPNLCALASTEGPITVVRQPGVTTACAPAAPPSLQVNALVPVDALSPGVTSCPLPPPPAYGQTSGISWGDVALVGGAALGVGAAVWALRRA
jgi:hypothetical protein